MNNIKHKVSDIAGALQLSERRVQQLVKEEVVPAPIHGNYNLSLCTQAYGQYLVKKQMTKSSSGSDLATEKLRLLKAQAEKAELELEVLKDKYIEVSEVEFEWSNLVLIFRARMLAIPSKLVRSLAAAGSDFAKIEQILEDEIYDALMELSKHGDEESDNPNSQQETDPAVKAESK